MERLTAFEFIGATDAPQLVRLKYQELVLVQFGVSGYLAWEPIEAQQFLFEAQADLVIEGSGLGRPYWNGELSPWAQFGFDAAREQKRIAYIRRALLQARLVGPNGQLLAPGPVGAM